ncbi:zinc finger MYND domain-containing protein 11-like isoform X2 [Limulus polyphemus]|uniref:Zinc finger MYND domain-containing protein 11-like isoform X2 n=1 Tax=Limulus polyphemus TaxID=6850 RepID=A0ABM1T3H0_LIMPO|nr:zinc finger MYND domain-containing protein 11-like isoform X2 [Limulus polyphemus]
MWAREIHSLPCSPDDSWIYRSLVYQKIDLNTMEEKITMKLYKNLAEFYCDVLSVVHNVIVMYGGESSLASLARQILEDCAYDMKEIRQCHRCYKISNEKQHKFWFCEPCDPPHELVWAKQKKFAFWPAKVIQKHDNYYDVRFFGGLHQRAVVSEACVKPIATSLYQLRIKKTSTFKKALKELYYHQRLLHLKKRKSKCSSPSVSKLDIRTKLSTENVMELKPTIEEELLVPQKLPSPVVHQLPQCSSSSSRNNKERQVTKGHCDCSVKYNEILKEFQRRIEEEYKVKEKRALKALADKMTKDFEEEKKNIIATALDQFHQEVEHSRFQLEHQLLYQHQQELQNLLDFHQQELLDVKRKQWCTICQIEAKYQCCWNTYYCSVECQYKHWEEHKWTCQKNASTDHKTDC